MQRFSNLLRQHAVGLLALTLVVGVGAAFAAGTKLPKNSVASKQVKNRSLKGKDLKDRSVTGADLKDSAVTGADLADGTVAKTDIAEGAVDEVRVVYYNGGGTKTLWEEPNLGKATFFLSCNPDYSINAFAQGGLSPARVGTYGIEDLNHGSEPSGSLPLVGAAFVQRLDEVGKPMSGAGYGGSKFGFGQVIMLFQTPKKDVYIDLKVHLCSASGTISIDHKPEGTTVTRQAAGRPKVTCTASGDAYCDKQAG